jgi:hypothetical protein
VLQIQAAVAPEAFAMKKKNAATQTAESGLNEKR